MIGITINELKELISYGHEAEFTYKNKLYIIQSEATANDSYLVIWNCEKDGKCICKYRIPSLDIISQDIIEKLLNEKCFEGKSFYEIETEIIVENIF